MVLKVFLVNGEYASGCSNSGIGKDSILSQLWKHDHLIHGVFTIFMWIASWCVGIGSQLREVTDQQLREEAYMGE